MIPDDTYRRWFALEGEFFETIIEAIYRDHVAPGDLVIDVGANHGLHTLPLARLVGRAGQVVAIEALPHLAQALRQMTRKASPQVRVVNTAVAATSGQADFVWVRGDEGFSGIRRRNIPPELTENVSTVHVKVSTIDRCARRWWERRRRLSFIKMDIEGGEFDALRGAKTVLTKDRPIVVFENGGQMAAETYGYTQADFFGLFAGVEYDLYDLFGRPLGPDLWSRPEVPWYAIAIPRESGGDFTTSRLPRHIERLEAARQTDLRPPL